MELLVVDKTTPTAAAATGMTEKVKMIRWGGVEDDGLVETPSSITTAGMTADSTTLASRSPLVVRRLTNPR